jgi:hypothetical protein
MLQKGVQPYWLRPYNTGRRKGSRNKPRPKPPALIELRPLELTPADEALMEAPATAEELAELGCHFRDIRRQKDRRRRHLRRYQPWKLAGGFIRPNRQGPEKPQRVLPEDPVSLEDPDEESPGISLADLGIDLKALRRSPR